jgi:hypothetical protein
MKIHRHALLLGCAAAAAGIALLLPPAGALAASRDAAPATPGVVTGAKVPGDFNKDAKPDLLFQHAGTGRLAAWMMDGTKPTDRVALGSPASPGAAMMAFGTDDLDGDGQSDILFYNSLDGTLLVWHMDGATLVSKSQIDGRYKDFEPVSVFDFDRDGNSDILLQGRANGTVLVVLLLQGTVVVDKVMLSLPPIVETFLDWRVAGAADFDHDGDVDLVLSRHARAVETLGSWADVVAIAFMDGTAGSISVLGTVGDRNWLLRGVADWSADGWPDLMWENTITGDAGVWEMQGTNILAQYAIGSVSNVERGWHIVGPR